MHTEYEMELKKTPRNVSAADLIARRPEKICQQESGKKKRGESEKYSYRTKAINQIIFLTRRQHQCLWLYHQHKNIKSVALSMRLSDRTAEEHLKLVRKKFQTQRLAVLMHAIDQRVIECVDRK